MFVIAGATGHTGSVAAASLLARGKPVTGLVHKAQKGGELQEKGARVLSASLEDTNAVAAALAGAEGAYLLIPPNMQASDLLGYAKRVADSLAAAVKSSGIPHVVLLSSVGAQHAEGTGPIRTVHYAESAIGAAAKNVTFLRAGYFMQNWAMGVEGVRKQGVLHNFLTPERKIPMVSTDDIGRFAAEFLIDPARGRRVVELAGPEDYSPQDIAQAFSAALHKPVKLETLPLDAVALALAQFGASADAARLFREMMEGVNSGHVAYEGGSGSVHRGRVTAGEAVGQLLGLPSAAQSGGRLS